MYPPDGLLTLEDYRHDVDLDPHIIAPDPFALDDCLNAFPPACLSLLTKTEELNTMNTGDDEPPSGLNGRLRPRKSHVPVSQTQKPLRKPESKPNLHKLKKITTPSKTSPNKHDDLVTKSDFSPTPQFLCAYCDRKFASKQTMSKHTRRIHIPTSKQNCFIECIFCNHGEPSSSNIIRHMVDNHPNQYFACLDCHTRFTSTTELAEHKLSICEKQKISYRCKLRQKIPQGSKKSKKTLNKDDKRVLNNDGKEIHDAHNFNGIVISCELKPSKVHNEEDIEDNITTNLILPPSKSLGASAVLEKNAVIVLDDIQWNKRIPPNFSFHNTDADQILSRLGVVHRSPRTGESTKRDWLKAIDDSIQKFERCFDTSFYSRVASNVQENLTKFLDGSFNFNPDPDSIIKTRKSKNNVIINTAEGFPILLAFEQYSRNIMEGYMPRAIAPKHKWKWDNLESDKNPINADQIRRDSHANNCIITLVSGLDIWTQLCMRRKFEDKFSSLSIEKKTEKHNVLGKELKEILESREIPTPSQVVKCKSQSIPNGDGLDFPASLGLTPSAPSYDLKPAVLSGEWVRPRCYVCCACGAQTRDSRTLSSHIASEHPNAQVQHYEIVGELLLNSDILKHLYVPPSQMYNRTRPLRGFRECTKCRKSITLEDLHQHMLDCAGDTPTVRRRQCRYRPFGVRRRRPRLPDNTVRKKMRKDIRTRQRRQKNLLRPRQRIRTEVGDAETIRKMLADLPAKRHRVLVNPMNQMSRPRRKLDKQRNTLILRKRPTEDTKNRELSTNKDLHSQQTSTSNINPIKYLSGKEEDDDNKPLISNVSRLQNKITRRNPPAKPVTRKTAINRAKRKCIKMKEQKRSMENINITNDIASQELSLDDSPQKIDINTGAYNTRDHANHSGSNNREDHRPGCSRTNANSSNSHAPTQNVPLKHSIARLTADSERHDKSVQFHHLFLVQQECNNTNQHMSSGQQTLFENEVAVTRLDKPPLNYIQRGSLDLQKNKQNKPRKGLNDCIAMLKNKLVDPSPCAITGHISVQCGTDEPLDMDDPVINHNTFAMDTNINLNIQPETLINKSMEKITSAQSESNILQNTECSYGQEASIDIQFDCEVIQQESLSEYNKPAAETIKQKLLERNPCIDINSEHTPQNKSYEICSDVGLLKKSTEDYSVTVTPRQEQKSNWPQTNVNRQQPFSFESENEKDEQKSTIMSNHSKPSGSNTILATSDKDLVWQNRIEAATINNNITGQKSPEVNIQPLLKKQEQVVPGTHNIDNRRENILFRTENVAENNLSDISVDIPPAHASTNVPSILSAPLDLSSKLFSTPEDLSEDRNSYNCYDSYGTLDLSNKCSEKAGNEFSEVSDVVVDLRVKPPQIQYESNTLDLCVKSITNEIMTATIDNMPTDLSIKGKVRTVSLGLSDTNTENADYIQDLSNNRNQPLETKCQELPETKDSDTDSPTDLSGKEVEKTTVPQMSGAEEIEFNLSKNRKCSLERTDTCIAEIPRKVVTETSGPSKQMPTTSIQVSTSSGSSLVVKNSVEYKKNQEDTIKTIQYCGADRYIQKPVYDPTLKIPQYKIRAPLLTTAASGSTGTLDMAPPVIVAVTTPSPEPIYSKASAECEQTPYSMRKIQLNVSMGSVAEPIPAYNLPSLLTTPTINKFESTTSVYTLANPHKSAAKIESSSSTFLANVLACKPETSTITNTTVYTLTRTSTVAATNYETNSYFGSQVVPAAVRKCAPMRHTSSDTLMDDGVQTAINSVIDEENTKEDRIRNNASGYSDQDPDTARKIALLPKELVEILGNMPADHRNQLLNVLPQYVSTPTTATIAQCKDTDMVMNTTLLNSKTTQSLGKAYDKDIASDHRDIINIVTTSEPQLTMSASRLISHSKTLHHNSNISLPSQMASQLDIDKRHSIQFDLHPTLKVVKSKVEDTKLPCVTPSQSLNQDSTIDTDKFLIDPFTGAITNRLSKVNEYDDGRNRIIDLTDEENVPLTADVIKVADDLSHAIKLPCQEVQGLITVGKPLREKGNNEKTSSLRAVRIKTPSERHKDTQLLKRTTTDQITKLNDSDDNEVNKSAESNKSLAIQQAEISSTQHSNKNVVNSIKSNTVSPNELESNTDNLNLKPRRISAQDENVIDKEKNLKDHVENPILKSGLVTSSISTNEAKRSEVNDENANETSFQSNSTNMSTHSAENSQEILQSKIRSEQSALSLSELNMSDPPIRCSTPKQRLEIDSYVKEHSTPIENAGDIAANDEDSEDDVSLAIIVKQKQQKLIECDEDVTEKNTLKQNTYKYKKKKKEKKQKKGVSKNVSLHLNTAKNVNDLVTGWSDIINSNDDANIKQFEGGNEESNQESVVTDKHSKKKTKKISSTTDTNICHKDEHSNLDTKAGNIVISGNGNQKISANECDLYNQIKSTQCYNQNSENVNEDAIEFTEVKSAENFKSTNDPQCSLLPMTHKETVPTIKRVDSKSVHHTLREENATKKTSHIKKSIEIDDEYSVILQNQCSSDQKKLDIYQEQVTQQDLPHQNVTEISLLNDVNNDILDPVKSPDLDSNKIEDCYSDSEHKKNKKSVRTKKSKDIDIFSDVPSNLYKDDKSITPLRRSRRGKSLFVDGNLCELENSVNNDICIDQKTPLTKKQLIFSKLLLDEETLAKSLDLTREKDCLNDTEIEDDTLSAVASRSSDVDNNDFSVQQSNLVNKCNKRKKSPHSKRKCKKKKSSDVFNVQDECNMTNLEKINTYSAEHLLRTHSPTVSIANVREKRTLGIIKDKSLKTLQKDICSSEDRSCNMVGDDDDKSTEISSESSDIHSDQNKSSTSIEKRKICLATANVDYSQSSKPKKTKLNKEISTIIINEDDNPKLKVDKETLETKYQKSINSEIRQTACYNTPVAARRTRSKSVVVKSSSHDLYDPYNIDLDDMHEKTEPFRKRNQSGSIFKESKLYQESVDNENARKDKTESIPDADERIDNSPTTMDYMNSKKITHENASSFDLEISSIIKADVANNSVIREVKDDLSDSDESSKSDVPLKKYVEEKEKKMAELDRKYQKETNDMDIDDNESANEKHVDESKNNRRTLSVCNNVEGNSVPNETEEQLRSEQFMESFGFFSERKPRKSNLLATKKISETFHIIANESDDMYFGFKDRTTKKSMQNENRKSVEDESIGHGPTKKTRRGKKKVSCTKTTPCYCSICKKEFRRPDNYLRHQMTLLHISKLSEIEMKVKTTPVPEEPNYLIAYKQQLDKLKILTNKLAKRKKNSKSKITLPTMEEIIAEVNRTVREQQVSRRGLSRDEALFLDCCELLKESHKTDVPNTDSALIVNDVHNIVCPTESSVSGINVTEKTNSEDKIDTKSDGDVDSITAKNILESEEVRNLENDLISGLKEAANVGKNFDYQHISGLPMESTDERGVSFPSSTATESRYDKMCDFDVIEESDLTKTKKNQVEPKDKMYPDLENIDIFEDKFDKIKRKCRSQAAAAKQTQTIVEPSSSHKGRKKTEKKKGKKNLKKSSQSTVLTKGALKGFDGIKVSIPTSDINISAIVPLENSLKKKKKNSSKKKREKKDSESSSKYDSDNRAKDNSSAQKKLDVYEFMDNEDAELFEFRPSTLMERFKSISSKDTHSKDTSKFNSLADDAENSNESASDGDDFVYMSDDYVCSDDETENSLLSCEMANIKGDTKKNSSPLKRKDVVEKNAVMGKIFKHNAVRSEKKSTKSKEPVKPKANLDQLFDSLLEDEPNSSVNDVGESPKKEVFEYPRTKSEQTSKYKQMSMKASSPNEEIFISPKKVAHSPERFENETSSLSKFTSTSPKNRALSSPDQFDTCSTNDYNSTYFIDYGPSTSKQQDASLVSDISISKKYDKASPKKHDSNSFKKYIASPTYGEPSTSKNDTSLPESRDKLKEKSPEKCSDYSAEFDQDFDDTGVARQRARRKCTVGKQNVLAETWSSESEPDGVPPRPNSAESVVSGASRKKKGKKKDAQQSGGRRGKNVSIKKQEVESRVNSSNGNTLTSSNVAGGSRISGGAEAAKVEGKGVDSPAPSAMCPPPAVAMPCPSAPPGPPGVKGRPRSVAYYWSSEGDEEQEHLQQHGWIVGDSHKKLVTMLAHAKGRKRNNDDKRHLVE